MKADMPCIEARVELSARLDGEARAGTARELDAHLSSCDQCRAHWGDIQRVRRVLRTRPAETVPDLVGEILARIESERSQQSAAIERRIRARIAAVAAAAAALIVAGATLWTDSPPETAAASEIARESRVAARSLETYRATFTIVERGWHPQVRLRRFSAAISYEAPESFRLQIRDQTRYPQGRWPKNDVRLIANQRRSWISEPSSCPPHALPACEVPFETEERAVVRRQPFDGTVGVPTDIILPLETLAGSPSLDVVGTDSVIGREALHVALPLREAVPLVTSLQPGGSWREFHPFDRVDLWIDKKTWFPLAFEVTGALSRDRATWAAREGLEDESGQILLSVTAKSFTEPDSFHRATFRAPREGIIAAGGFRPESFEEAGTRFVPSRLAGLTPYRAGSTRDGQTLLSYTDGMAWLKVIGEAKPLAPAAGPSPAEEVRLSNGWAYYLPATESLGRRVQLQNAHAHVHLESNLPRARLLSVAGSLRMRGKKLPGRTPLQGGGVIERVAPEHVASIGFARAPSYLPAGYSARAAYLSRTTADDRTITIYYRRAETETDGVGIRITQSDGVRLLPPSPERWVQVPVGSTVGRWSPVRGELEWVDDATYTAVAAPSFDLATALQIARHLR